MDLVCTKFSSAMISDGVAQRFRVDYSRIRNMNNGEYICSPRFTTGPFEWVIICYPRGCDKKHEGMVSLYLKLVSDCFEVSVSFDLAIIQKDNKGILSRGCGQFFNKNSTWGFPGMIRISELEEHYIRKGYFVILCTFTIIELSEKRIEIIEEPPQGRMLFKDIRKLGETKEMADVKFSVEGEIFSAHRIVLGARSEVFKAELFGSMAEREMDVIPIKDMQAAVFKALLHFVYTDSLPNTASSDMIRDLLVAADRYAIKGLVAKCQERLLSTLSIDTVLGYLIIADRHSCSRMKAVCLDFASKWENFSNLAVTEEYSQFVCSYPSLMEVLRGKIKRSKTTF